MAPNVPAVQPQTLFAALDNAVEETAASATGGVADALAESALLCHVEHAVLVETVRTLSFFVF